MTVERLSRFEQFHRYNFVVETTLHLSQKVEKCKDWGLRILRKATELDQDQPIGRAPSLASVGATCPTDGHTPTRSPNHVGSSNSSSANHLQLSPHVAYWKVRFDELAIPKKGYPRPCNGLGPYYGLLK